MNNVGSAPDLGGFVLWGAGLSGLLILAVLWLLVSLLFSPSVAPTG